jgi:hypothetical protein
MKLLLISCEGLNNSLKDYRTRVSDSETVHGRIFPLAGRRDATGHGRLSGERKQ